MQFDICIAYKSHKKITKINFPSDFELYTVYNSFYR